jgi:hypothetical protein
MQKITKHISDNLAEYYVLLVIVVAVPLSVSLLTSVKWGLFLSFLLQAFIGVLYIKGRDK